MAAEIKMLKSTVDNLERENERIRTVLDMTQDKWIEVEERKSSNSTNRINSNQSNHSTTSTNIPVRNTFESLKDDVESDDDESETYSSFPTINVDDGNERTSDKSEESDSETIILLNDIATPAENITDVDGSVKYTSFPTIVADDDSESECDESKSTSESDESDSGSDESDSESDESDSETDESESETNKSGSSKQPNPAPVKRNMPTPELDSCIKNLPPSVPLTMPEPAPEMKTLIIGDSMVKNIDRKKIERAAGNTSICHSYSGAKIRDITEKLKEQAKNEQFNSIVIHVGTNNLVNNGAEETASSLESLIEEAKVHSLQLALSSVLTR